MGSSAFTKMLEDAIYGDEKVKNMTDNNLKLGSLPSLSSS